MLDFSYHMPVEVFWGNNVLDDKGHILKKCGNEAAIITGRSSAAKCGALADVVAKIRKNGQDFQVFNGVENDPSIENVLFMAKEVFKYNPKFLIAIGGGSVLDAAKVIGLLLANGIREEVIWQKPQNILLPLLVIPTTAGTGSEVTPYAVLTDNKKQTKRSVNSPLLYPQVAFLDPRYTESLPHSAAINCAIDALSHLLEGFFAKRSNNTSDLYALEGMRLISKALPGLQKGDLNAEERELLLAGSFFGGLTIAKTGTTLVHALGYSLTFHHKFEHGKANGMLLASYLEFIGSVCPGKLQMALDILGFKNLGKIREYLAELFPLRLSLSTREIAQYVENALKTANIQNTPGKVSGYVLANILEKSLNSYL